MQLGSFSVSLTVKDLAASREFYGKLGFDTVAGDESQGWLILRNESAVIGLFRGMFETNILTFNPGWGQDGEPVESFTDVRELQNRVRAAGIEIKTEADEAATGPAAFVIEDPDGNPILIDQHV
jgi:catechol 2,3-dioxygenase-like lactoylglutathione lyase family enzyme